MKASLSEMFAVLRGITRAGVPLVQAGENTKTNPIARLAFESAAIQYDKLSILIQKPEAHEKVAKELIGFFEVALPTLVKFPNLVLKSTDGRTGGTVLDLTTHMEDVILREGFDDQPRPTSTILNQKISENFNAAYLPQGSRVKAEKPVYEEVDRVVEPPAKRQGRMGGRPKKQSVLKIPEPVLF